MLIKFFSRLVKILTNLSKPSFLYLKNKFYTFYANNLNKTNISILIGSIIISLYYIIEYLLFPLGKAVINSLPNSTPLVKFGAGLVTSTFGTGLTKMALDVTEDLIKSSKPVVTNNMDTPPSPDTSFVSSSLEYGDLISPLERIIYVLFTFNVYLLIAALIIIYILVILFIVNKETNKDFLFSILNRFIPNKFNGILKKIFSKGSEISRIYLKTLLAINVFFLFFGIFLNLFANYYLINNIDNFISVYNHLHSTDDIDKAFLIFFSIKNYRPTLAAPVYKNIRVGGLASLALAV